jgi:hypothetical protein
VVAVLNSGRVADFVPNCCGRPPEALAPSLVESVGWTTLLGNVIIATIFTQRGSTTVSVTQREAIANSNGLASKGPQNLGFVVSDFTRRRSPRIAKSIRLSPEEPQCAYVP